MSQKRTVLITGCSAGGIGSALALSFHKRGHRVFATARSSPKVAHLKATGITTLTLDVTSAESISAARKAIEAETGGKLDILVNNSGIGYAMPFLDADLEQAKDVFEVNVFGRWAVTQALAPLLIASKGTIINIGSISGVNPTPWSGIYNAACGALHQWSDTLRLELAPLGVKVILVITGAVQSNFLSNLPVKSLPGDSLYLPCKEKVEATMQGSAAGEESFSTDAYADLVVENVLKPRPKKRQWAGNLSTAIWAVNAFLWSTAWDLILPGPFGLNDLAKKLTTQKAAG